jgi:hypothetical protein
MRRVWIVLAGASLVAAGCGKAKDPEAQWFSSPTKVVEGIMHAYETRNDTLYASFFAKDYRYYFQPVHAESTDFLGWGKDEEVAGTSSLFKTPDVTSIRLDLQVGKPHPAAAPHADWMVVPISGGEMVVSSRDKDPMQVALNRQEIILRPRSEKKSARKWEVVEWHDYPNPDAPAAGG